MTTKQPLLSIIVPVYNVEQYLPRCIESILNQTYTHLELILINDGSTDDSLAICRKYEKKDGRIRIIDQENGGSSIARNAGLNIAKGDFIGFVDSDDWILPEFYFTMIKCALDKKLNIVESAYIDSKRFQEKNFQNKVSIKIEAKTIAFSRILNNSVFAVWPRLYRKNLIGNLRFIPHKIHQDVFFTMDILKKIDFLGHIDKPMYVYNIESESVIRSPYNKKKLDALDAPLYVIEETKYESKKVRLAAINAAFKDFIRHYNSLFTIHELDKNYEKRNLIKTVVSKNLNFRTLGLYPLLIALLPFKTYNWFHTWNTNRISKRSG